MNGISQLLTLARRYAEIEGVPLSTVSSRALNDGKKLSAIIDGGADMQVGRLERAICWFSEHWPEADWPSEVPRPVRSTAEAAE